MDGAYVTHSFCGYLFLMVRGPETSGARTKYSLTFCLFGNWPTRQDGHQAGLRRLRNPTYIPFAPQACLEVVSQFSYICSSRHPFLGITFKGGLGNM